MKFDFLEVALVRSGDGRERLGLTICHETDSEDKLADIFIDDIHPDGLAATDGRLRLGDQIIQVSGALHFVIHFMSDFVIQLFPPFEENVKGLSIINGFVCQVRYVPTKKQHEKPCLSSRSLDWVNFLLARDMHGRRAGTIASDIAGMRGSLP